MNHLEGNIYGPYPFHITPERVSDFVEVTGDDPDRWVDSAPPGFAAAALFVVAPELLDEMVGHSVIHGEQTFTWHEPLSVGSALEVTGTVTRIRARGGVNYVTFDITATGDNGVVLEGSSLFLVTGDALPATSEGERAEPPHSHQGDPGPDQRAASRADLVRHAAATRDWNPIHWDHDAAVAAGLPGVVVHGLMQASWALAAASNHGRVRSARIRFRNPLFPARPADLVVEPGDDVVNVRVFDVDFEYVNARLDIDDG